MRLSLLPTSVTQSKTFLMVKEKMRRSIVKKSLMVMSAVLLLAFIFSILTTQTISITHWLNTSFFISIIILLAGCILLIIQGGFFDRFVANFKYFWRKNDRAEEIVREVERRQNDNNPSTQKKIGHIYVLTKVMILSGIILVLISVILSYLIVSQ